MWLESGTLKSSGIATKNGVPSQGSLDRRCFHVVVIKSFRCRKNMEMYRLPNDRPPYERNLCEARI